MVLRATTYRPRAAQPQPIKGRCADPLLDPNPATIGFVLQTFKAEKSEIDSCDDQANLLCSNDMLGLGGLYVSASYTAQRFLDPDTGGIVFQSQEAREAQIIDEDDVPGLGDPVLPTGPSSSGEQFEFIDCSTISIQYQINGLANVSFTVVSTEPVPGVTPPRDYTQQTFGGVNFTGWITQLDTTIIPASIPTVWEHRFSLVMVGCADDCPRGATRPT